MAFDSVRIPFKSSEYLPRQLQPLFVHVLPQVEIPGLPKLYSNEEARKFTRTGVNKWTRVKKEIDCIEIDGREWYTAHALLAYLRRKTRKGRLPEPRTKLPPKLTPPAAEPGQATDSMVTQPQRTKREAERRRAVREARVRGAP